MADETAAQVKDSVSLGAGKRPITAFVVITVILCLAMGCFEVHLRV